MGDKELASKLAGLISEFRAAKPAEPGEMARRYAITITDLERAFAFFTVFVGLPGDGLPDPVSEAAKTDPRA